MNKQHLSDRLSHPVAASILALATFCTLLTGTSSAFANPTRSYQSCISDAVPTYRPQAIQSNLLQSIIVQPRLATQSATPTETVKRYLKFIRQGIWDHTQQAPQQATTNFWYAYNMLSEGFKRDIAGDFNEFMGDWIFRCDLKYTENQISLYQQVGDTAVVYAPIEMPGCSETGVQFLKLKLEPQGRSWQIDAACSTPYDDCRGRSRRW
jgi:hypothetical protein